MSKIQHQVSNENNHDLSFDAHANLYTLFLSKVTVSFVKIRITVNFYLPWILIERVLRQLFHFKPPIIKVVHNGICHISINFNRKNKYFARREHAT
jgi:hypothetical protein